MPTVNPATRNERPRRRERKGRQTHSRGKRCEHEQRSGRESTGQLSGRERRQGVPGAVRKGDQAKVGKRPAEVVRGRRPGDAHGRHRHAKKHEARHHDGKHAVPGVSRPQPRNASTGRICRIRRVRPAGGTTCGEGSVSQVPYSATTVTSAVATASSSHASVAANDQLLLHERQDVFGSRHGAGFDHDDVVSELGLDRLRSPRRSAPSLLPRRTPAHRWPRSASERAAFRTASGIDRHLAGDRCEVLTGVESLDDGQGLVLGLHEDVRGAHLGELEGGRVDSVLGVLERRHVDRRRDLLDHGIFDEYWFA